MIKIVLILCLSLILTLEARPEQDRILEIFTTSHYYEQFTDGSKQLLKAFNLENKRLVRDDSVQPSTETIKWTQTSRCWFGCKEEYRLVDYYEDGDKKNPVMKVFVAKKAFNDPPQEFQTSGHQGKLHFGYLYYGDENSAIFLVLHDNSWRPYQHRFKTNTFTKWFNAGLSKALGTAGSLAAGAAAGVAMGAAFGSIVPGIGTVIGAATGLVISQFSDDVFGDYLRYIG